MLTTNADAHPLMRRMHKPEPKLCPMDQDKRSVSAIEAADYETWPAGPHDGAAALIQLTSSEAFEAGPEEGG